VIALDNLNQRTPIVDSQGQPTREFMIKWQQLKAATGAIPALETAAEVSAVLDIVGSPTPGGLLVRGASEWEPLPIGAADDVLTSISGAPVWAPSGAAGLSGAMDAQFGSTPGDLLVRGTTAWVALSDGVVGDVLAPTGALPNGVAWYPLTAPMDHALGSVQGSVAYRNATQWVALGPGTSGQVLTSAGAGANPAWVTPGGGGGGTPPVVVQFDYASANGPVTGVTMGVAPTNNNLLVAFAYGTGGIGAAAGWTLQQSQSAGLWYFYILTKVAGSSEPALQTPISTGSSMYWTIGVYEVSNQNAGAPLLAILSNYGATSPYGQTAVIANVPSTLALMTVLPSNFQSTTILEALGCATLNANLSSAAGAHAAFGWTDSSSAVYNMLAVFSASETFDAGTVLITH
jgi:hypothetical protein